jgi:hypothetical protein
MPRLVSLWESQQCTEVHFASFLSGGFITAIVVNPPERRLAKRTSVQWDENLDLPSTISTNPKTALFSSKTYFLFYRDTIVSRMRSKGVLTGGCGESAIRLRPALIFEPKHAEIMLEKFEEVLTEMEQKH